MIGLDRDVNVDGPGLPEKVDAVLPERSCGPNSKVAAAKQVTLDHDLRRDGNRPVQHSVDRHRDELSHTFLVASY
jgi:hypothetical protein